VAPRTDQWPKAPHDHVVQFYDHDDELADGVGPYLVEAIQVGGVAIVIATEPHRNAFAARLAGAGIDPESAQGGGRGATGAALVMLDARDAADALLIDGQLAPHRFDKLIGDLVRAAAAGGRTVRAYGEILALLWADGHVGAALELEELWNGLGREVEFCLYCAYPRTLIKAGGDVFHQMCRRHSTVVGPPVARRPVWTLSFEVEATFRRSRRSPSQARRFVTGALAAWGCADLLYDAALIATELATNAVLHAGTDFTIVLSRRPAGQIRIAVRDTSSLRPRPRNVGPLDGSGRGLALVEVLAAGWGADLVPGGKVVWADLQDPSATGRTRPTGAALTAT
jgi:DcmR-like sensory protein/histidine kinase-like protein